MKKSFTKIYNALMELINIDILFIKEELKDTNYGCAKTAVDDLELRIKSIAFNISEEVKKLEKSQREKEIEFMEKCDKENLRRLNLGNSTPTEDGEML